MNIWESRRWRSDLDETIGQLDELNILSGQRVMVTGCTGLICSAVTDLLIRWNEAHEEKITILAAARNKEKTLARFSPFAQKEWFQYVPFDSAAPECIVNEPADFIIHGASNASPDKIIQEPVETMLSNILGMKALLEEAKEQEVSKVLFISSSEVYGKKDGTQPYKANEYGFIDLLNPRNSYSIGKRAAETLCISYEAEYNISSVIVRPGHVYGPTASEADQRVSSAWAYAAARGQDLVMKSDGSQIRSYCYCLDCASAILKVLIKGERGRAYNISNPDSIISIREMAQILARSGGVELRTELPTEAERKGFNPMSNSSLDSEELLALGWKGLFDAERGFAHTIEILREMKKVSE